MTELGDLELRMRLVGLGATLAVERYPGQHKTDGAHEFAEKALPIVKAVEDRIVERLKPTQDGGVWVAYHHDMSCVVCFADEIECLRYATEHHMEASLAEFGVPIGDDAEAGTSRLFEEKS